jgi:hypothetical protein
MEPRELLVRIVVNFLLGFVVGCLLFGGRSSRAARLAPLPAPIYRCDTAAGVVYQDTTCPAGARQGVVDTKNAYFRTGQLFQPLPQPAGPSGPTVLVMRHTGPRLPDSNPTSPSVSTTVVPLWQGWIPGYGYDNTGRFSGSPYPGGTAFPSLSLPLREQPRRY